MLGRLAQDYPHLVALGIDDFFKPENLKQFPGEYIAELQSRMRLQASWLNFVPTVYYGELDANKDIARTVDSVLFYFRNNKQGEGPCSRCSGHTSRKGCLDGVCAEPTVANAPGEIKYMSGFLPAGRKLQVGVYFCAARHIG